MNIEIITTPNKHLKESGFGSEIACKSILKSLRILQHTSRINICEKESDLKKVLIRKPDLVILAVKYIPLKNEPNIYLSDYFKKHNINYTGSNKDILKFDSNKVLAKSYLKRKGIPRADFFIAIPKEKKENNEILKSISNYDLKQKVEKLACDSFLMLGVRDFGRIDIKTNKKENVFFSKLI